MTPERPLPEHSRFSWKRLFELLAVLFFALVVLGLLFPAHTHCGSFGKRGRAKMDASQLVTAIKQYYTEYGSYPLLAAGRIENESTQALLLQILQAQDRNHTLNPRRIPFFEPKEAVKEGRWGERKYVSGIHPESRAFVDPWGRPYRVWLDLEYKTRCRSPYNDEEDIASPVLVWSLGEDGVQGSPGTENILKDSDDVVSWR